jgi:hypothetical protein
MENTNERTSINDEFIDLATKELIEKLNFRLKQKGKGTFTSTHEITGIITEEYHELIEELKNNNIQAFKQELLDIAVACLFGVACIDQDSIDW